MKSLKNNPDNYNFMAGFRQLLPRTFIALLLILCSGLSYADLEGFVFTDTISNGIRPFELDTDTHVGGSLDGKTVVCAQGVEGAGQVIRVYLGDLMGSWQDVLIDSGGQYFSSSCYTKDDSVFGTYIDFSADQAIVFYEMDSGGNVSKSSYPGPGFNSVDSGPIRVNGNDYIAAVGITRNTLESVMLTDTIDASNPTFVYTDTHPLGNPFAGYMVGKVASSGLDGIMYSLGQTSNFDVVLKEWDVNEPLTITVDTHVLDPAVDSTGFPNESGLYLTAAGRIIACYFNNLNPTVSAIDDSLVISNTGLPQGGNNNYDIDCRPGINGNVDVFVSDMHYEVNPGGQLLNTHVYSVTTGDTSYIPVAGMGGSTKGLFGPGSLSYGLGFAAAAPPPAPATPVPALSDWMLIVLALVLLGAAGWIARRQKVN